MEAYQAYYNTNENTGEENQSGRNMGTITSNEQNHYNNKNVEGRNTDEVRYPENGQNMKIINNIMHINHSGANINIMCGSSGD